MGHESVPGGLRSGNERNAAIDKKIQDVHSPHNQKLVILDNLGAAH